MNRCKNVLLASAIAAALASAPHAMAQQRTFEVPAQPAVTAIPELARQAQVQIIAPAGSLEGIDTPAIAGEMDAREALRTLLAGTGLTIKSDEGNVILLQKAGGAAGRTQSEQQIGSGGVRGRVLNTATGEYVRNAEIRVEGHDDRHLLRGWRQFPSHRRAGRRSHRRRQIHRSAGVEGCRHRRRGPGSDAGFRAESAFLCRRGWRCGRAEHGRSSPRSAKARPAPSWNVAPR